MVYGTVSWRHVVLAVLVIRGLDLIPFSFSLSPILSNFGVHQVEQIQNLLCPLNARNIMRLDR